MIKIKSSFFKCISLVGVSAIARANDVSSATAVLHIDDERFDHFGASHLCSRR